MVVLVYAATFEMKNIRIHFVDHDKSIRSSELIHKFSSSRFFIATAIDDNEKPARDNLLRNKADVVCIIPPDFDKDLTTGQKPSVQLLLNAVNGSLAELSLAYCYAVIRSYSEEVVAERLMLKETPSTIQVHGRHWYNPDLNYKIYMAPGILALLITIIGWLLTGMNLVKEKEMGTIEQLNVTPIRKYQFIAGKLIPFLIIGLADLAFGLIIARIMFHIPVEGSLFTLFIFTVIYLIAVLGIGLFISTISNTQQQVLFVSFFFVMIFILMSGLFTAVENMPEWGQKLNIINPMAYSIRIIRMVLLKGSGFVDISEEMIAVSVYALFTNGLAIWRYRKTV
jgi:ABC-2 type transport system permease protein